jgi:hypothetical protein
MEIGQVTFGGFEMDAISRPRWPLANRRVVYAFRLLSLGFMFACTQEIISNKVTLVFFVDNPKISSLFASALAVILSILVSYEWLFSSNANLHSVSNSHENRLDGAVEPTAGKTSEQSDAP